MTTAMELERPPKWHHVPEHVGSYGAECADLAETVGLTLDPEQRLLPDAGFAYDEQGRLVSTEVGCSAPRQNIKTHGAKAMSLADLVLFGVPQQLWSAHLRATSDDAFRNPEGTGLADLFDNFDFLRRLVDRNGIVDSDGEKSITLRPRRAGEPQPTLTFMTRSERGGRGLTGRRVTFDEALFLKPSMLSAMIPILSARSMTGQVQVRYLGSPGLKSSQSWRDVRDRGRAGDAKALAWLEWAATRRPCLTEDCGHQVGAVGCVLDDPEMLREANLAIDRRIHLRFVMETERRGMTPEDYMRERMGWWDDPVNAAGGDLDHVRWLGLADPGAARGKPVVFGVDVGEDRLAHIAVAWRRPDGRPQLMLTATSDGRVDSGLSPLATSERLRELVNAWGGLVVLGGPAAVLEQELPGVAVSVLSTSEFVTGCGRFEDLLTSAGFRHGNQQQLNDSVERARWRSAGTSGERAWQLRDAAGIGPLAAATRALHGLLFGNAEAPAAPRGVESSSSADREVDVVSQQF